MSKPDEKKPVHKTVNYAFKDVDKQIVAIGKKSNSLQSHIHNVAISILAHWARNNKDAALCAEKLTALQDASPYHSKAFADWVAMFTGLNWAQENSVWYAQKDQKLSKEMLDAAKAQPFWVVSKPTAPKPLTNEAILKMLNDILVKQERHSTKPVEGDAFTTTANKHIREAIKAVEAEVSDKCAF